MSPQSSRYCWFVDLVFFFFMLLHQTDKLMIGPMQQTIEDWTTFFVLMCLTAVFMPLSGPNVTATVYDITVPEVRSTAHAVEYFIENIGAVTAPFLAGVFSVAHGKGNAILRICVTAWVLCFFFYLGALFTIDKDTGKLRTQMAERAKAM